MTKWFGFARPKCVTVSWDWIRRLMGMQGFIRDVTVIIHSWTIFQVSPPSRATKVLSMGCRSPCSPSSPPSLPPRIAGAVHVLVRHDKHWCNGLIILQFDKHVYNSLLRFICLCLQLSATQHTFLSNFFSNHFYTTSYCFLRCFNPLRNIFLCLSTFCIGMGSGCTQSHIETYIIPGNLKPFL